MFLFVTVEHDPKENRPIESTERSEVHLNTFAAKVEFCRHLQE